MWLPRDERKLLAGYYKLKSDSLTQSFYSEVSLHELLRFRPNTKAVSDFQEQSVPSQPADKNMSRAKREREIKQICERLVRVEKANKLLHARDLLELTPCRPDTARIGIKLSIDGYDLGRRYSTFWDRTGLWFKEHRNHWIILILGLLAGILGTLFIRMIESVLQGPAS